MDGTVDKARSKPHCIIIGAGPGVGMALARRFGREGFRLSLIARRHEALARYVASLSPREALGFAADAGDPDSLRGAIQRAEAAHGPTDVLCYNAAARANGPIESLDADELAATLAVNVGGALIATQCVLPSMKSRRSGTLLFTGGGLSLRPLPNFGALALGKAAQRSLAASLGLELADSGVYAGSVMIAGFVQGGTDLDPDRIAGEFWRLHADRPAEREVLLR